MFTPFVLDGPPSLRGFISLCHCRVESNRGTIRRVK